MAKILNKEAPPFPLTKPNPDTYLASAEDLGYGNGSVKDALDNTVGKTDGISKEATQSEEDALVFTTDGGTQVGKIDSNGADFANLKRGGQQVARMSDLPTKDTSIGDNPSTTNVPTTKAVKDYVDAHGGEGFPIDTEAAQSETEEQVWGNDAETQEYAKIGSYGVKSKAYLDMNGESIIDGEIGNTPSTTHAPSAKAVKDYVDEHGGGVGDLPISEESTQSEDEEFVASNDAGTNTYAKVGSYGIKAKAFLDLDGSPISSVTPKINNIPCQLDKEELRILDIGNSFTDDSSVLVPTLLAETSIDASKVALYRAVRGGASFKTWFDCYHDNDLEKDYYVSKTFGNLSVSTTGTHAAGDGTLFRNILSNNRWDVIVIHQVSTYSGDYSQWEGTGDGGYLREFLRLIRIHQPQACIYFDIVHATKDNTLTKWQNIARSAMKMAENYGVFIIPYGTAIQNLRQTSYNNSVDLTCDGLHLGRGLARYTAACTYFETLFAPRIKQSVYGNAARYTCTQSDLDVTYPQSCIDVTNDNAIIAQRAAILACTDFYNIYNPQIIAI